MSSYLRSLVLFFIILLLPGRAQTDTINQYNTRGNKHGYWKVYFDRNLASMKDRTNAMYYGIDYYHEGRNVTKIFHYRKKDTLQIHRPVLMKEVAFPVVLDGEYVYYDRKHTVKFVEVYKNGRP